jgi:hypothetical protein
VSVAENFGGDLFIKATKEGTLAVGISNTPDIYIYSLDGKLIRSFKLTTPPLPVTDEYIKTYRANMLKELKTAKLPEIYEKGLINAPIESLFEKNLPYYRDFEVDAEGNFLFFKWYGDAVNKLIAHTLFESNGGAPRCFAWGNRIPQ